MSWRIVAVQLEKIIKMKKELVTYENSGRTAVQNDSRRKNFCYRERDC